MRPNEELIKWAVDIIDRDLAETGSVDSGVAIMNPGGIDTIVPLNCPEAKILAIRATRHVLETGIFAGVVFIAEAWASVEAAKRRDVRASKFPDREEVLTVWVYGRDGKAAFMWKLDRSTGQPKRGEALVDQNASDSRCWLEQAFEGQSGTA